MGQSPLGASRKSQPCQHLILDIWSLHGDRMHFVALSLSVCGNLLVEALGNQYRHRQLLPNLEVLEPSLSVLVYKVTEHIELGGLTYSRMTASS